MGFTSPAIAFYYLHATTKTISANPGKHYPFYGLMFPIFLGLLRRLPRTRHHREIRAMRGLKFSFRFRLSKVRSLAVSPDGSLFASGAVDSSVRLWAMKPTGLRRAMNL